MLVARTVDQGRSSAGDLVVEEACLVRCRVGSLRMEDLGAALEVDLEVGSRLVAAGHRKTVAGAVEVADMMIGGGAWGIVAAGGSVVAETWRTQEAPRSLVSL